MSSLFLRKNCTLRELIFFCLVSFSRNPLFLCPSFFIIESFSMRKRPILLLCILSTLLFCSFSVHALKPKSKYFKSEEDANNYLIMHYNLGSQSYNCENWHKAASEFEKVIFYFPCSDAAVDASYYLAVCYFKMREYDFANEEFSNYLKASSHPAFFEGAVQYKFCIAEHFKGGKKRRPFKMRYLPKWISAQDSALVIYDEVVAALPNSELAVQALYSKADLLKRMKEYRDSIEIYQIIIRRFPRNEIVPACYLNIADAYVRQSRLEFQNPDILALAELNVRKFSADFPRDERVAIAEESVCRIKELYAKGLCDLGLFYERIHQPAAAAIYYQSSIEEFPDTRVSRFCRLRLINLGYMEEEPVPCLEEMLPVTYDSCLECSEIPVETDFAFPIETENQAEEPAEFLHYSVIKHRDQYVPCED